MKKKVIKHAKIKLLIQFICVLFSCLLFNIAISGVTLNKIVFIISLIIIAILTYFIILSSREKLILDENEIVYIKGKIRKNFRINDIEKVKVLSGMPYSLELIFHKKERSEILVFETLGNGLIELPLWIDSLETQNLQVIGLEKVKYLKKINILKDIAYMIFGISIGFMITKYRVLPELKKLSNPVGDFPSYYGKDHDLKSNLLENK